MIAANGERQKIKHGWNSKEVQIGKFYVDGYAVVDGKRVIFEYDGCAYHGCARCEVVRRNESPKNEDERKTFFKNLQNATIITISSCDWYKEKFEIDWSQYQPKISSLLFKSQASGFELVSLVEKGSIYGFMIVDISPTDEAQKWMDVNWPPIFQKSEIKFDDLSEWMKHVVEEKDFPLNSIVQRMHGQKLLLHTSLLKFYLAHGFTVDHVYKFFEYEGENCFSRVFQTVYEARVEATETEDDKKATAVKLVSNSMYGSLLLVSQLKFLKLHCNNITFKIAIVCKSQR